MASYRFKPFKRQRSNHQNGFSMIETMIAGVLLASSLTAVSRMSITALSGSRTSSYRAQIEAAINNNIQTMQKEDSYFTYDWISRNQNISDACQNPPEALKDHLQNVVSGPNIEGISRTFDSTSIPGILTVEYNFEGPEQAIGSEIRLIEMNPNFSSECYI